MHLRTRVGEVHMFQFVFCCVMSLQMGVNHASFGSWGTPMFSGVQKGGTSDQKAGNWGFPGGRHVFAGWAFQAWGGVEWFRNLNDTLDSIDPRMF